MPSFEIARYRYQDRITVLGFVQDALHGADAPIQDPSGQIRVIVEVTPPDMDVLGMEDGDTDGYAVSVAVAPDTARGCATKVTP